MSLGLRGSSASDVSQPDRRQSPNDSHAPNKHHLQHPTSIQYHHPHTYPSTQTTNTPWPPASPPRSAAPPSPVPPSPTTAPLLSDVRSRPRNNGCRTPSSRRPFASLWELLGERESYICLFNLCAGSMGKASCNRRMWFAGADVGEHRLEALGLHAMDAFRGKIERRREGMDALWPRCLGTLCRGLRN